VLQRDNGIESRHLAPRLARRGLLDRSRHARPALPRALRPPRGRGGRAGSPRAGSRRARSTRRRQHLHRLPLPGASGYVVERLGLRDDVQAFDLVGQGCAARCRTCSSAAPAPLGRRGARALGLRRGQQRRRCTSTTIPAC
jgi:alkylresorcinol/alkylpyrone synthase